jgi:hypothetical protein
MSIAEDISQDTDQSTGGTIDLTHGEAESPVADLGRESTEQGAFGRPEFTITDAATACAVSRKTITRKLADLAEHGAAKDEDGIWRIPVEALLAVGLHPGRSVAQRPSDAPARAAGVQPSPTPRPTTQAGPDMITVSRDRWDDLRIRLARAEAQAAERDLALADARLALRALTAGPATPAAPPTPVGVAAAAIPVAQPNPVHTPSMPQATLGSVHPSGPESAAGSVASAGPVSPVQAFPPPGPIAMTGAPVSSGDATAPPAPADPAADLARARSEAARTGGYVPAAQPAGKRRRWWQSK